jgi:predicted dehydrogenase
MSKEIGVAVIGCGAVSASHLAALRAVPEARLIACADVEEKRAEEKAREFGAARHYAGWEQAVNDKEVQAVVICLPHHLHAQASLAAARAGKHILIEKPMALSLADAKKMAHEASKAGVTLMVGQVLRYRPTYRMAKRLLKAGIIGVPSQLIRRRLMWAIEAPRAWATKPAEAGGWLLYGYGSHEVDMILWLIDSRADSVFAMGKKKNPIWRDFDEISMQMSLTSGAMATLCMSLGAAGNRSWDCLVIGSEGAMLVADDRVQVGDKPIEVPRDPSAGMEPQMRAFIDAVTKGIEPESAAEKVLPTMAALEAAKVSLRSGLPVRVESAEGG